MCNHYRNHEDILEFVQKLAPWVKLPDIRPQFRGNMYPKYPGPVVAQVDGEARLVEMRWGVWPFYQKKLDPVLTNARSDGILTKRTWKQSAQSRRCLVPATGYFEPGLGPPGAKGEVLFTVPEQSCFFIAGLWDVDPDQSGNRGFTLVTTEPNALAGRFHDRMPVVLSNAQAWQWFGADPLPDSQLLELCRGLPAQSLAFEEIAAKPREKLVIKRPDKKQPPPDDQPSLF